MDTVRFCESSRKVFVKYPVISKGVGRLNRGAGDQRNYHSSKSLNGVGVEAYFHYTQCCFNEVVRYGK